MKLNSTWPRSAENTSALSQSISSLNSFLITFFAIHSFEEKDFSIWFIISGVNIYLQGANRSAFLELELLRKRSGISGFLLSAITTLGVNSVLYVYANHYYPDSRFLILFLVLAYTIYQTQDILRYFWFKHRANLSLLSDFGMLLVLVTGFAYLRIHENLSYMSYSAVLILASLVGVLFLVFPRIMFEIQPFEQARKNTKNLQLVLLGTSFHTFAVMTYLITVMAESLKVSQLTDFRVLILCLSPISAFLRLDWVRQISKASADQVSIPSRLSVGRITLQLLIFSILATLILSFLSFNYITVANLVCVLFGVLSLVINTSINSHVIYVRKFGSAGRNLVILNLGILILFIYALQFFFFITLLGYFVVTLIGNLLTLFYVTKIAHRINA